MFLLGYEYSICNMTMISAIWLNEKENELKSKPTILKKKTTKQNKTKKPDNNNKKKKQVLSK